jgi:hypothetical protein
MSFWETIKQGKEEATPYVVIDRRDQDGSNHQQPIRDRNEELPVEYLRSVDDFDLREVGEFHHLRKKLPALSDWDLPPNKRLQLSHLEGCGNDGLRGNNGS